MELYQQIGNVYVCGRYWEKIRMTNNLAKFGSFGKKAPEPKDEPNAGAETQEPSAEPVKEGKAEVSREETELERTSRELEEAKAGRLEHEIPLSEAYWDKLKAHQAAYHRSKV